MHDAHATSWSLTVTKEKKRKKEKEKIYFLLRQIDQLLIGLSLPTKKMVKLNELLCFNFHCRICDWTAVCRPVSYRHSYL